MPYALCPMPYALFPVVPHLSEKGYMCIEKHICLYIFTILSQLCHIYVN
jgi:hypothetical protein